LYAPRLVQEPPALAPHSHAPRAGRVRTRLRARPDRVRARALVDPRRSPRLDLAPLAARAVRPPGEGSLAPVRHDRRRASGPPGLALPRGPPGDGARRGRGLGHGRAPARHPPGAGRARPPGAHRPGARAAGRGPPRLRGGRLPAGGRADRAAARTDRRARGEPRPARRVPRHALRGVLPRGRPGPRPPLPRGARGAPSRPLLENSRRLTRARGRALTVVLAAALLAACVSLRAGDAGLVRLTLLQINDVYVVGPVGGGHRGGMARLATLVRQARRATPNTVFVLAGDTLSPSVESRVLRGAQMVAALNAIGLDLATFGNQEFDFGPGVLRERIAESRFVWLSSNVVDRPSGRPFGDAAPDLLLTFDGVRVGFLGLTTPETAWVSSPGPDVVFGDPRVAGGETAG